MNVHEYQAKALFREYGVAVPEGVLATTPDEAARAHEQLARAGGAVSVVKAQIHAGGRGKGGGVKLARSADEARAHAEAILGMTLVTHQTGAAGKLVRRVYVEAGSAIARELYLALTLDRASEKFALIASTEGGMDIEQVAEKTPEKIHTEFIDPNLGLYPGAFQIKKTAHALGLGGEQAQKLEAFLLALFRLYLEKDASLIEINPLVVTEAGALLALDGKLNFDAGALFRHPDIAALRDPEEEDERERAANEIDLAYVGLDGDVGCMVNGAGLAMATLDMITVCGGAPANFLDAGGGADKEKVKEAFKLILRDEKVRAILVNIFGGIVRCDLIAEGVVAAAAELDVRVPLVVRLQGTNAAEGRALLAESGLDITPAETLREAAERAVAAAAQYDGGADASYDGGA